ncbi:hypothetical protein CK203_062870 [Vitis vinifera]|uniref:Uncharacterized protein n=1 Tax=Vitis vinifera TaxID=29760 RepID=A0A438FSJ8_VITVI|nr:hypothetical protein CK203_062870 [Vitis vinifera]
MRNSISVGRDTWKLLMLVLTMAFDTWLLVSYFYDDMSFSMKQLLETMCGGDFMSKNLEEAMDFLNTDMKAKFTTMARRLEELEHLVEEYPMMPDVREMFGDQGNVIGQFKPNNNASYGNTYNSNWRNHQNFSWKLRAPQYTQPGQAPPQAPSLEQGIMNLSKVNPKGIHEVEAQERESSRLREVKAMITVRSGKEVDLFTSKPEHEPESESEKEKREEIKGKRKGNNTKKEDLEAIVNERPKRTINQEEVIKKHMSPPFPRALHGKKGIINASKILEVLRQVKVSIPLLNMIKQVSTYAKFLNDLCTIKRGLNVSKKAFLTKQVSSIIQCKSLVKYKDLGYPTSQ